MPAPLDGVLVVDLSRILAGPFCTMQLGDMGARVIKVEPPGGDETRRWGPPFVGGESTYYLSINRNKESLVLDLRAQTGREILHRMLARADVIVENFRPGTLAKWDLDYASLHERYPRLIYASISGYGHTGPRAHDPGFDLIAQGEGGVMSLTGPVDGPPYKLGTSQADLAAGWLAVQGILLALIARDRSGDGQHVDVSLLDGQIAMLAYHLTACAATGVSPKRLGNAHPSVVPYDVFETADGYMTLGVGTDAMWRRMCAALAREDWAADVRYATNAGRIAHRTDITRALRDIFRRRPTHEWVALMAEADVPCGPVHDVVAALADPQVVARESIARISHPTAGDIFLPGVSVHLSDTPGTIRLPPPLMGQDTDELLSSLCQFTTDEILTLRTAGVVA